jgi:hypothetical protein
VSCHYRVFQKKHRVKDKLKVNLFPSYFIQIFPLQDGRNSTQASTREGGSERGLLT